MFQVLNINRYVFLCGKPCNPLASVAVFNFCYYFRIVLVEVVTVGSFHNLISDYDFIFKFLRSNVADLDRL